MKKKDYYNYLILTGIVFVIYMILTHFTNVFGSDTDWINQHTIIPDYFRQLFYKTGNLIPSFSFNYGGGQNIFNLSYYGFLSPIILPSYLLPFVSMKTYMTVVDFIIVVSSGILFYKWILSNKYNRNISLVTSIIFVLSESLIFQMHRHVMFVNYMPFLLMGLMGVDKLFNDNKKSLLIISIFLMIMTSYYYSVGGIVVIGIYYLYRYFSDDSKQGIKLFAKDLGKFILYILIPVLMAGVLLIPTMYTLLSGRGSSESAIKLTSLLVPNFNFHKIFCGNYTIGLSMLGFISLLYLFYSKKKNNVILGILLSIVFFIPIFMYILNGGLYLRAKCFIPFAPLIGYLIALFINDIINNKIDIKKFIIYILFVCILLYYFNQKQYCYLYLIFICLILILYNKFKYKNIIYISLCLGAFGICLYTNFTEDYVSKNMYNEIFNEDIENSINNVILNDNDYYRSNSLMNPTKTVNKMYNDRYYTTNIYSSTYNYDYLYFVRDIFKNNRLEYNYFMIPSSDNILFDTYMGVKYLYSDYDPGLGYESIGNNMYVNDDVFPMLYASNNILNEKDFDSYEYPNYLELLLNNVITNSSSNNSIMNNNTEKVSLEYDVISNDGVDVTKNDDGYVLKVKDKGTINIKLKNKLENKLLFINLYGLKENSCRYDNIVMSINNMDNLLTCRGWTYANKNYTFRYLISDKVIQDIDIKLTKGTYNIKNIETYVLDYDNVTGIKDRFDKFNITNFDNDTIEGNINVTNDNSYFVTSIPYDKGFTIKVDNKVISYEKVDKAFVGFPITKGKHDISIVYTAPGLKYGLIFSITGFIIYGMVIIVEHKKSKKL